MELVAEHFELSLGVESRLNQMAENKGINLADLTVQRIGIAYKITSTWHAGRQFYCETTLLALPQPRQLPDPTFHHLRINIYLVDRLTFDEIASKLTIDKQSVLSWAMDCLMIIERTLMTDRVFYDTARGRERLKVSWIHKS